MAAGALSQQVPDHLGHVLLVELGELHPCHALWLDHRNARLWRRHSRCVADRVPPEGLQFELCGLQMDLEPRASPLTAPTSMRSSSPTLRSVTLLPGGRARARSLAPCWVRQASWTCVRLRIHW
ncbi:hypothetical protein [Streptomyces mirabilis]|uniref:hypothetical protein n=1 Tax=Streptomyces mirabilis TaxID=68239 RepID=UPI00368B8B44